MVSRAYVIGLGMGNPQTLTREAHDALSSCGLIVGSERLIEGLSEYAAPKVALVAADEIAAELGRSDASSACVVMSGDVGFYSGATRLYPLLDDRGIDVRVIPGVSSLVYLCGKLRVPWQDVHVVSVHGRAHDAVGAVQSHEKTFVLLGGTESAQALCAQLAARGLGEVAVAVGERLSYADESIACGTASELAGRAFAPLAVALVRNLRPLRPRVAAPQLSDDMFCRGQVPMTKEEVRELAVCKLRIRPGDVVWDVGAGTGSVSVEMARAAYAGQVFAVERSEAALGLIARNKEAFGLVNLRIVAGEAPAALAGLPAPDRVFVGGSSGHLAQILAMAVAANAGVRLCVSAITLETLSDALASIRELGLVNADIAQVSVTKAHEVGAHHMMRAHNPVYLICAEGCGEDGVLEEGTVPKGHR